MSLVHEGQDGLHLVLEIKSYWNNCKKRPVSLTPLGEVPPGEPLSGCQVLPSLSGLHMQPPTSALP